MQAIVLLGKDNCAALEALSDCDKQQDGTTHL